MSNRCNGEHKMWAGVKSAQGPQQKYVPCSKVAQLHVFCKSIVQIGCTCKKSEGEEQRQTLRLLGEVCPRQKVAHKKPCSCDVKASKIMLMTALLLAYCQGLVLCADASLW